jgi:peptidoglycan/xylan/chitin deacetylase (PgdA/CDA1 family)
VGRYKVLLSRRDFLRGVGLFGGSLVLSSIGWLPQGPSDPGLLRRSSNLAGFIPPDPENDFVDGTETVERIEFLAGHEVRMGDQNRRTVLMTYDDQGHHKWIDKILDAYQLVGGKASFFFTGSNLLSYINQIQRIVLEGHVFGCHGLVHVPHTALRSDEIRDQTREWLRLVDKIIPGYQVRFFRFPYGDRNERVKRVIAEFGLQSVHWNIESGGSDLRTFDNVVEHVFNGSIVLSHMFHYYDVYEAESILKRLKEDRFALESLETGMDSKDIYPPETHTKHVYDPKVLEQRLRP